MPELIRLKGSDKVYLVKSTKHWIKTAETLEVLGYHFGEEVEVDAEEFANFEEGEPIEVQDSKIDDVNKTMNDIVAPEGIAEKELDNIEVEEIWQ